MLQAIRSKAWALLLLAAAAPVAAADTAELFKCVDAVGVTSIQSEPCAKGSTQVWRRDATPEPPRPAAVGPMPCFGLPAAWFAPAGILQ